MRKVITFGSCLSRRIAALMTKEFGWELRSAVMQTKVGQYVRQLNGDRPRLGELTVLDVLSLVDESTKDYEVVCNNISQQQCRVMGTFSTSVEQDLDSFESVMAGELFDADDLFLIDTFADLLFRSSINDEGQEIFAPTHKMKEGFKERWALQDKESVARISANIASLCKHVRQRQPNIRIVVMNFPFDLNPSEETLNRMAQLQSLLNGSEALEQLSVEVVSLPSPSLDDCRPLGNYHHYRQAYYRNALRMLATPIQHDRSVVVAGGTKLLTSLRGKLLNYDVRSWMHYEQRLDTVVERDIWKSKMDSSCQDPDARFSMEFDLKGLPVGSVVIIDAAFNVDARLSYSLIDEVGTASPIRLPLIEGRPIALKKLLVMTKQFIEWLSAKRPDCHIVVWVGDGKETENLTDFGRKRLSVLSRMLGTLRVTLCAQSWAELEGDQLDRYLFGSHAK